MNEEPEEVYVDCSDDENYDFVLRNGEWFPPPNDVIRLYEMISDGAKLDISWQCFGRRPPTPTEQQHIDTSNNDNIKLEFNDASDFDFEEETASPKLTVRPTGDNTPKGSAKKKTTTFDGIMSNIERHRKLNMIQDKNTSFDM